MHALIPNFSIRLHRNSSLYFDFGVGPSISLPQLCVVRRLTWTCILTTTIELIASSLYIEVCALQILSAQMLDSRGNNHLAVIESTYEALSGWPQSGCNTRMQPVKRNKVTSQRRETMTAASWLHTNSRPEIEPSTLRLQAS